MKCEECGSEVKAKYGADTGRWFAMCCGKGATGKDAAEVERKWLGERRQSEAAAEVEPEPKLSPVDAANAKIQRLMSGEI